MNHKVATYSVTAHVKENNGKNGQQGTVLSWQILARWPEKVGTLFIYILIYLIENGFILLVRAS